VIQLLIVFTVIKIFQLVEDRKVAAMIAASLFLSFPLWVFISELRFKRYVYWGHFQFFFLFALPIFLSRIMYWDQDFQNIRAFGVIPASLIHKYSNYSYILMMGLTAFQFILELFLVRKKPFNQ
jgi:hypothetical protein